MTVIRAAKLSERAFRLPAKRPRRDESMAEHDAHASGSENWVSNETTDEQVDTPKYEMAEPLARPQSVEEADETELGIYTEHGTVEGQATTMERATPDISYEEYKRLHQVELDTLRERTIEDAMDEANRVAREGMDYAFRSELDNLKSVVQSAQRAAEQDVDSLADAAVEVVYEAVLKILGKELVNAEGVVGIVREAIRHAKDRSNLIVRVAPADLAVIRSHGLEPDRRGTPNFQIAADDRVELGGCLLETPAGNLDGRLETQLQLLRETLLHARTKWNEPEA